MQCNGFMLVVAHLICSISSIALCIYTAKKYVRKTLFESSTKELIIALYAMCTFYAVFFAVLQFLHLLSRYTASAPCDSQIPKLIYPCMFGYATFHKESLDGLSPYCVSFNKSTEHIMMLNLYCMIGIDMLSVSSTLALYRFNKIKLTTEREKRILLKTFHRKQCIFAIEQFLPITIIHTTTYVIIFIAYTLLNITMQHFSPANVVFLNSAINVMPYYCVLAPFTLLILIRKGRFERISALNGFASPAHQNVVNETYFRQLREQWS
ncbi:hypothetical protein PRIPAC_96443 [Pristionchus pacificus]|uniref:G protein-coupled receptor n=1 Tax=Pristionchus pacificus TaxID=54126 RepID=A0A2A6D237_PRIPA|nr:hypothetical protein PRIPAC_96443 [Pristionchus pacificus]|eukprot:PDM84361.1 G protein-coupled receptor [Pristionchus pacificus]